MRRPFVIVTREPGTVPASALQGRERDRRSLQGGPSLLLRRLPPRPLPRSTPRRLAISASSAGGAATSPKRGGDPIHRRRAVHRQQSRGGTDPRHRMAARSTCATSTRPSWRSALKVTTSHHPSRRSDGSSTCTRTSTRSAPTARPSSIPFTRVSAIWVSSFPEGVAKKEHGEFSGNIDLIDTLPPGL